MARRRLEAAIQAGKAIQQGVLSLCNVTILPALNGTVLFYAPIACWYATARRCPVCPVSSCCTSSFYISAVGFYSSLLAALSVLANVCLTTFRKHLLIKHLQPVHQYSNLDA